MRCIVTAGPTWEAMDKIRRLTNFSTGRLGTELANFLVTRGHQVTLLIGEQATYGGERRAQRVESFTTTENLREKLQVLAEQNMDGVLHAAAVSDFKFGKIWSRSPSGELSEVKSGKVSTRQGGLLAELMPTPKIIAELRDWYPRARLVGWKFEVDGDRAGVLRAAEEQLARCCTDACVANGPAYGNGFGLVTGGADRFIHAPDEAALFAALEGLLPGSAQ
jgi:phosphopantothenoylcysteine decarboxylase/phosphopantothenate--cysteine ligase